ncbi:hypothetical protein KO02_09050 [Sphingobacterium sp. ML3W]|uniref:FecR family protein n=1 Tax=Sphingobacterium sp. ML3W TaxID=1538644 RepID=UPI0004F7371B|nr:FecR family protein [Sphingobacterium sp. ML3W]AIM36832.1 hypothetical protein KO02_09050 [Sphingobacterium sp. ML3W]
MIEDDKILLAELSALVLRGVPLTVEQELVLARLAINYPEADAMVKRMAKNRTIETHIDFRKLDLDKEWSDFNSKRSLKSKKVKQIKWKRIISAAASIVLIASFYMWINGNEEEKYIIKDEYYGQKNDILPGDTLAILEIEGDERFILGKESTDDILRLTGNKEGEIKSNLKHKVIIPNRSVYHMVLSDGTKVWLNSESNLEYFVNFSTNERRVILQGEAYFDVASDSKRPFIVEANQMTMQAVGTAFNVTAYSKESKVVLTEGKLKVNSKSQEVQIDAGKQVEIKNNLLLVENVPDMEGTKAWMNGYFYFDNKALQQIMEEVSRWYGVELQYHGDISNKKYQGGIKKDVTLAKLCAVLTELTGYQFKINEKKLIINNLN